MKQNQVGDLIKQVGQMRKSMDRVQEELRTRYVEASVGGGKVEVTMNGQQEVVKLSIDPSVFAADASGKVDGSLVEDLVIAGFNQALEKSKKLMNDELNAATGGLAQGLGLF
jgi:DNA-binding YbaB/EbfC family protein